MVFLQFSYLGVLVPFEGPAREDRGVRRVVEVEQIRAGLVDRFLLGVVIRQGHDHLGDSHGQATPQSVGGEKRREAHERDDPFLRTCYVMGKSDGLFSVLYGAGFGFFFRVTYSSRENMTMTFFTHCGTLNSRTAIIVRPPLQYLPD